MTALTMKSVITSMVPLENENASHCVGEAPAHKMPSVEQQAIRKFVSASLPIKEMVTHSAINVRLNFLLYILGHLPMFKFYNPFSKTT